jgi:hypothetical protein
MVFNFVLECASKKWMNEKAHENQLGLKLNGIHQFLAYADDLNSLGDNIVTCLVECRRC